jgi:hypothetical protein
MSGSIMEDVLEIMGALEELMTPPPSRHCPAELGETWSRAKACGRVPLALHV